MKDDRTRLRVVRERRRVEALLQLRLRAIEELSDARPGEPTGAAESDQRESRRATHLVIATVLRERLAVVTRLEQRLAAGSYAALDGLGPSPHGGARPEHPRSDHPGERRGRDVRTGVAVPATLAG